MRQFLQALARRIVIANGTGRLALYLARYFYAIGEEVITLSRFPKPQAWQAVHWDGQTISDWTSALEECDAIINLSPRSASLIGDAVDAATQPPRVWIDSNFAISRKTRFIQLRFGAVMNSSFGVFPMLLKLSKLRLYSRRPEHDQQVRWVHSFDFISAIEFLLRRETAEGAINIEAPSLICLEELLSVLARSLGNAPKLHLPQLLIRLLHPELFPLSNPPVAQKLESFGFEFRFPDWKSACEDLMERSLYPQ